MKPSPQTIKAQAFACINNRQFPRARSLLEKICTPDCRDKEALLTLAAVTGMLGDFRATEKYCRQILKFDKHFADAHFYLGNAYKEQGKPQDAINSYLDAIRCNPNQAGAYLWLGNLYRETWQHDKAETTFNKALTLFPNSPEFHYDLGNTYKTQGKIPRAVECFKKALSLKPDYVMAQMNIAACMPHDAQYDQESIFQAHRSWGQMMEKGISRDTQHANSPDPERRLKIGYASPDFRKHSVSFFIEPILSCHDPEQFEITCYAELDRPDDTTTRLKSLSHNWRDTKGLDSQQLNALIREDGIDILVDLAGLTQGSRLDAFVYKPAPIQLTYLGYAATTGLLSVDYRLTDNAADPAGASESFHTETLLRLPEGFLCYQAPANTPEVSPLPALKKGHITFGSFNNLTKITPKVVETWAGILKAVPESTLLVKTRRFDDQSIRDRYRVLFNHQGIADDRLQLRGQIQSEFDHLNTYADIDIALDSFPYNGTTTTFEALWMGVPVIALEGSSHISRVGYSILHHAGLDEYAAKNQDDYISIATELACDPGKLADRRAGLREKLKSSPLCDGKTFTRHLEQCYRTIWKTWCGQASQQA